MSLKLIIKNTFFNDERPFLKATFKFISVVFISLVFLFSFPVIATNFLKLFA